MARSLRKEQQGVTFVEGPPRKRAGETGRWIQQLNPLLKHPGRWALIWTAENAPQANKLQSNLHSRQLLIPEPKHVWEFAARGCEVYAVYRGRKRGTDASVRRANRGG